MFMPGYKTQDWEVFLYLLQIYIFHIEDPVITNTDKHYLILTLPYTALTEVNIQLDYKYLNSPMAYINNIRYSNL